MSFLKEIPPIIRLFQIVGISPFAIDRHTMLPEPTTSKSLKWFSLILIFLFIMLLLHRLLHMDFYTNRLLAAINRCMDVVQILAVQSIAVIAVIESFIKRGQQIKLIYKITEVDEILTQKI